MNQKNKIDRRKFIRQSATLGLGLLLTNKLFAFSTQSGHTRESAHKGSDLLKGFIVSDAHFGWENETQPSIEKQKQMIDVIRHRFPDLDLCLDTGDAHHNGKDRDEERGQWTDIILSQDIPLPFYYVPGNHEIAHANNADPEFVCARLGSHEARPYYSFDIKGIHFVSVPELMRAVYIPRELLEWLKLDLELNKSKTTILLSHNSLIGYSKNYAEGYRGVANTQDIIDLMNQYPNCVAWMYGHNHNYEVVRKGDQLFVSNGRIGGFDPSRGKHGLGGIYFEIAKDRVDIRCYSAEFDKYIDEFDKTELYRGTLDLKTSLDIDAPVCYSAGCGMARNGEKSPLYHHHIAEGKAMELFIAGVPGYIINEDPDFKYYMYRESSNDRQLMGCSISNNKNSYEWKNPGIQILASQKNQTMTIPRTSHNKYTYYRVAAGQRYKIDIDLQGLGDGGQHIVVRPKLYDRSGTQVVAAPTKEYRLSGQRQLISHPIDFPEQKKLVSIYTDENSDNVFNLSVEIEFIHPADDIMVHRVEISFDNADETTLSAFVKLNNACYRAGKLSGRTYEKFDVTPRTGNRSVMTIGATGNGMATWLLRLNDVRWQVLGAACEDRPASMIIGPMRNLYSHRKEVAINRFGDFYKKTFVSRMRNVNFAEIFPLEKGNREIKVCIQETLAEFAEIEVYSPRDDLHINGAQSVVRNGSRYVITVKEGDSLTIS